MPIRVECPKCNQTLEAPEEIAGRAAICPTCRTKVQIPPRAADDRPTALSHPQEPDPKPRPTTRMERIESMISDVRSELRTLNRRVGYLILLFAAVVLFVFAAAALLINRAGHLY